jgi:hypothetical protein
MKNVPILAAVLSLMLAAGGHAQENPEKKEAAKPTVSPQPAKPGPVTPLKVTIVLSRYQGDKKASSLPFTLSVNTNDRSRTSLRLGAKIPISSAGGSFSYQDVGTNIDCVASTLDDGRYRLELTIEDSSVYGDEPGGQVATKREPPAFRSFRSTNTLIMKDGQSTQYTTATDKVSGEITKVDVTVNTMK